MPDTASLPAHCKTPLLRLLLLAAALLLGGPACAETVRVGVYANEPKLLLNADGHLSGILGELLEQIAEAEGWTLQAVPCEWQQCLEQTRDGSIDLMPDVAWSEERAAFLSFHTTPALFSWSQLYSQGDLRLASLLDLQGRRIAVLQGSVQQEYLKNLLDSFGIQAELLPQNSLLDGFALVASGGADAAVANQRFGDYQAPRFGLRDTTIMFQPARLFFASGKGRNANLLAAIDEQLLYLQADNHSAYYQILERWGGQPLPRRIPMALWWGLAALGALLLLTVAGNLWLRRRVAAQTRHILNEEKRLNTILDSVDAFIYIKDHQLRYQYANRKVCELFGQPQSLVVGQTDAAFFDAETVANLQENDHLVLQRGERVETEEVNRSVDGSPAQTFLSVKIPLRHPDGSIYALCGISTDISEHKKNLEQIHQLAFYDPLTGLANRRLLLDRLHQALARHGRKRQEGALLFIDLDHFKDINDTLGHALGDQLLQQVSERLREQSRAGDTLARLGGDEFVLLLEGLTRQPEGVIGEIEAVAGKVLRSLAAPYELAGQPHNCTASIGVALFSDAQGDVEELLKRADLAMYEAKGGGRNALRFFNPQMQARINTRTALEREMRAGLERGEFFLHYQPQIDLDGQLLGAEALVRWQHPQRGVVAPGEFIPPAESSGLILPLGRYILRSACAQLAAWSQDPQRAQLTLAVNVSARQLHGPEFVDDVLRALADSGANPARLELELTESQLAEDVEAMIERMQVLRERGVRFALDDFGTGYSSLSYLKRLPLARLKIDQSFVRDLLSDANDVAIVRTIVALGQSLELEVIAEGVERQEQLDLLRQLGCRKFQGYLFGRPGPAEALGSSPLNRG